MRKFSMAAIALVAGLGMLPAGCSQVGGLKAKMAFKDANALYQQQDYRKAAEKYEEALQADPVYTPLVAVSLLVFFVLALQCMSTLAIARRELNSWFWPFVMWAYMTGLAYLFSFVIYQGGRLLGWG